MNNETTAFDENYPTRRLLNLIGDKWTPIVQVLNHAIDANFTLQRGRDQTREPGARTCTGKTSYPNGLSREVHSGADGDHVFAKMHWWRINR
jgi:hypothetical protein